MPVIKQIKTPDGNVFDLRDAMLFGITDDGGMYYPPSITPESVGVNSILISEAYGLALNSNRCFAIVGGYAVTLNSTAAAGATRYEVANTFDNRFICAAARDGYATIDESTAGTLTVKVTDVYLSNDANRTPLVPYSGATENNNPIVIETDESANPDEAITELRLYGSMHGDTSFYLGNEIGAGETSSGRKLLLGQAILAYDSSNVLLLGGRLFNNKNRVLLSGYKHINTVEGAFMNGEGHDSTLGTFKGLAAHGKYSDIKSDTAMAIGNGTSDTARSNLFEVKTNGDLYINGNMFSAEIDQSTLTLYQSLGWTPPSQ